MAQGYLEFDVARCKACELCVYFCPREALGMDKHRLNILGFNPVTLIKAEMCNGCGICAMMCPDSVITVLKE